jgi:hypothetical protein
MELPQLRGKGQRLGIGALGCEIAADIGDIADQQPQRMGIAACIDGFGLAAIDGRRLAAPDREERLLKATRSGKDHARRWGTGKPGGPVDVDRSIALRSSDPPPAVDVERPLGETALDP